MHIGTLHSLFLCILEEHREFTRLNRNYRVLDDFEQNYLIYQHIREFEKIPDINLLFSSPLVWEKARRLAGLLNIVREERVDINKLAEAEDLALKAIDAVAQQYNTILEKENCLDFTGIQTQMLQMLEAYPRVLAELQEKIAYSMIDEYPDTNTIQETILLKLAAWYQRICVVGDDDQSLYRFRGATVQNILLFAQNFTPGTCRVLNLETDFRSHPEIIRFYNDWMTQIPGNWTGVNGARYRAAKTIKPQEKDFPEYRPVVKVSAQEDEAAWHEEVFTFLKTLQSTGKITDYNQVAFLFRSVVNDKVKGLARFLETQGIPVYAPMSDQFFERNEVKCMIGALLTIFADYRRIAQLPNGVKLSVCDYED